MRIKTFSTNKLQTNCYLVEHYSKCIIIDPSVKYDQTISNDKLEIVGVFLTHAHFDHIEQIKTYQNKGLKFYMHKNAYEKLTDPRKNMSILTGINLSYNLDNETVIFVDDKEKLDILGPTIEIMYTPGHTDCSIMLIIEDYIFSGDMVFRGSIGRYDFYSSNYDKIMESVEKIKNLPKNYIIYPGHGNYTSLDFEKKNNPFFR